MSAFLTVSDLHFAYPEDGGARVSVFSGFSAAIEEGQIVRLVGSNGSGKSTLLNLIAGRLRPSAGRISIGGKAANSLAVPTAYLRQKPLENVAPNLSVEENLAFASKVRLSARALTHNSHCDAKRIEAQLSRYALSISHLDPRQQAGTLSGGQMQWLALAMVILTKPALLLLDEPTASLDQERTSSLFSIITAYSHATRTTIVYVCHDSSSISTGATEAISSANLALSMSNTKGKD